VSTNIFESKADALVNPINCVGVMGGGLAKSFRLRYWDMNKAYQMACAEGMIKVGKVWPWWESPRFTKSGTWTEDRWIINFPTKDDWRDPSEIDYIENGLDDLTRVVKNLKLTSIAIPALGCGLGGLSWKDQVQPLLTTWADEIGIDVELYPPQ
jgi:O-acetyl-ADP-ribose deacetylase (regulator of RNase III)